jgi:beta-dihydromenaquinone-9 omega-hydroxylase
MTSATEIRPSSDFDPFSPEMIEDPYPSYAGLHAGPRVLHVEKWDIWVLSRHQDVTAAVRDHARLSSSDGVTYVRAPLPMMLTMDPPDHERLRRIAGREFAPRDIHRFRSTIEDFVKDGMDAMASGDVGDVVEHLAIPVPIRVMAFILGVPNVDIPLLRGMADDLIHGFKLNPGTGSSQLVVDSADSTNYDFARIGGAIAQIHSYFGEMIAERRRVPAEDLVTRLIQPADEGTLTADELLWFCLLLLVAGIETTTNLIGNMTIALANHPDQWHFIREHPETIPSAVLEALRFDPPIQMFYRGAVAPYQVDDVEIPSGSRVLLPFGAANRDPVHYPEPDQFKADRNPVDHIAFGGGIHRCLGASLAELEGRVVLEQLVERADVIEIAGEVVRTSNPTLRGARKLPVNTAGWR